MLWLAEPEQERRLIQKILQGGLIDGVIVSSMLMTDPVVKALLDRSMPFVLVGRHPTDPRASYVDVDNRQSAREMVAYLLRLGYSRVATITGPENMIAGADRLDGYKLALRDRGTVADPALIASGEFTEAGGYAAMRRLIPHLPDAVFCASDMMAAGALRALREMNIRVPEDMGVAGYDDIPLSARMDPPLTTVRQPITRTGAVAAETLIDMLEEGESRPRRVILPTEIVIRSSVRSI
jgi:LacI family transcriptional regulator